jgi:hypothetical protein
VEKSSFASGLGLVIERAAIRARLDLKGDRLEERSPLEIEVGNGAASWQPWRNPCGCRIRGVQTSNSGSTSCK